MLGIALFASSFAIENAAAAEQRRSKLVCAGAMCVFVTPLNRGGMGAEIRSFPGKTTHVNMRCSNGRQVDSRREKYIYCNERQVMVQHCKKELFSSSCSRWFVFTPDRADYAG